MADGRGRVLAAVVLVTAWTSAGRAADPDLGSDPKELQAVLGKAVAYLRTSQAEDGSFSPRLAGPGISALATAFAVLALSYCQPAKKR